jgi:hypothetical protein
LCKKMREQEKLTYVLTYISTHKCQVTLLKLNYLSTSRNDSVSTYVPKECIHDA